MADKRFHEVKRVDHQEIRRYQRVPEPPSRYLGKGALTPTQPESPGTPTNPIFEFELEKTSPGRNKNAETYPPIVTIDGRVDTDIDHLIEDITDDYTGPVDEIPSKFPKPHVFSVIEGSLDDDVDSYANDDGTMEHTLVDAPKNFNPRDLKDVASKDRTRQPVGQAASGQKESSHSNRSYNKTFVEPTENEGSPDTTAEEPLPDGEEDEPQSKKSGKDQMSRGENQEAKSTCRQEDYADMSGSRHAPDRKMEASVNETLEYMKDDIAEAHTPKNAEKRIDDGHLLTDDSKWSHGQQMKTSSNHNPQMFAKDQSDHKLDMDQEILPDISYQSLLLSSRAGPQEEDAGMEARVAILDSEQGESVLSYHLCQDRPHRKGNLSEETSFVRLDVVTSRSASQLNSVIDLPAMKAFGSDDVNLKREYFENLPEPHVSCHLETLEMRCASDSDSFSKGSEIFLSRNYVDPFNYQSPSKSRLKEYVQYCQPQDGVFMGRSLNRHTTSYISGRPGIDSSFCSDKSEQRISSPGLSPPNSCKSAGRVIPSKSPYPSEEMKRHQIFKDDYKEPGPPAGLLSPEITLSGQETRMSKAPSPAAGKGQPVPQADEGSCESLRPPSPVVEDTARLQTFVSTQSVKQTDTSLAQTETLGSHSEKSMPQESVKSSKQTWSKSPKIEKGTITDTPNVWLANGDYRSEFLRKEMSQESGVGLGSASHPEKEAPSQEGKENRGVSQLVKPPATERPRLLSLDSNDGKILGSPGVIPNKRRNVRSPEDETDSESLDLESFNLLRKLKAINDDKNKSKNLLRHVRQLLQDSESKRDSLCSSVPTEGDLDKERRKGMLPLEILELEHKTSDLTTSRKNCKHVVKVAEKLLADKEDKRSKQASGEKKSRVDKSLKHMAGEKDGGQVEQTLPDRGSLPLKGKGDTSVMPVFQELNIKTKKGTPKGTEELKNPLVSRTKHGNSLTSQRTSLQNHDSILMSEEEDSWYQPPMNCGCRKLDPNPCAACTALGRRRGLPDKMYNSQKLLLENGLATPVARRMKYPYDYYDTSSIASLASSETIDIYSNCSGLDSEVSVPSYVRTRLSEYDRRSASTPRNTEKPPVIRRWYSPDPYSQRKGSSDLRRKDFSKCTVKTSLRAAIRVAEESMSAAARVAEALNFVMKAGKMTSPNMSFSSSSEDDRKTIDHVKEHHHQKITGTSNKAKVKSKSKPKSLPEAAKSPKQLSKKPPPAERQSLTKEKSKSSGPGTPTEKKKRSHPPPPPQAVEASHHLKTETNHHMKAEGECNLSRPELHPSKPPAGDAHNGWRSKSAGPDSMESRKTLSTDVMPKSDEGPRPALSSTAKNCCGQHVCSRGPQVTIHIAYPKTTENSPKQDKRLIVPQTELSGREDVDDIVTNQDVNVAASTETLLELPRQGSQCSDCSQGSRVLAATPLDVTDVQMVGDVQDQPSETYIWGDKEPIQFHQGIDQEAIQFHQDIDQEPIQFHQVIDQKPMQFHQVFDQIDLTVDKIHCSDYLDNVLTEQDWTLPLSSHMSTRNTKSYFTQAQPVIDPKLQGMSVMAKRFYRRQLVGSCVDPVNDSVGSDTDSLEYNANFNKSPRDALHGTQSSSYNYLRHNSKRRESNLRRRLAWTDSSSGQQSLLGNEDEVTSQGGKSDSEYSSEQLSYEDLTGATKFQWQQLKPSFPSRLPVEQSAWRPSGCWSEEKQADSPDNDQSLTMKADTFFLQPPDIPRRRRRLASQSEKDTENVFTCTPGSRRETGRGKSVEVIPRQDKSAGRNVESSGRGDFEPLLDKTLSSDSEKDAFRRQTMSPPRRSFDQMVKCTSGDNDSSFPSRGMVHANGQFKLTSSSQAEDSIQEKRLFSQYLGQDEMSNSPSIEQSHVKSAKTWMPKASLRSTQSIDWDTYQRSGKDISLRKFSPIYEDIWHEGTDDGNSEGTRRAVWSDFKGELNNNNANKVNLTNNHENPRKEDGEANNPNDFTDAILAHKNSQEKVKDTLVRENIDELGEKVEEENVDKYKSHEDYKEKQSGSRLVPGTDDTAAQTAKRAEKEVTVPLDVQVPFYSAGIHPTSAISRSPSGKRDLQPSFTGLDRMSVWPEQAETRQNMEEAHSSKGVLPIPWSNSTRRFYTAIRPEPFGEPMRTCRPSVSIEPLSPLDKRKGETHELYQRNPGQYRRDARLCRHLAKVQPKTNCVSARFSKPFVHPHTVVRMWEQERIARDNETLVKKLSSKESVYSRQRQLQEYEDKLPRLIGFSRMPQYLMQRYRLLDCGRNSHLQGLGRSQAQAFASGPSANVHSKTFLSPSSLGTSSQPQRRFKPVNVVPRSQYERDKLEKEFQILYKKMIHMGHYSSDWVKWMPVKARHVSKGDKQGREKRKPG